MLETLQKHWELCSGVYSGVHLAEEVADGAAALASNLSHSSGAEAAEAPRQNTCQKSLLKATTWALHGGSNLPKRRQPSPAQVQQAHAEIGLGRAGGQNLTRHESRQSIATGDGFKRIGCCTTLLSQGLQAVAPSKSAGTESLMLVAAARRSVAQSGKSSTN